MHILHISAECYPAAKTGGLADVVSALPTYQNKSGEKASVIIPKYATPWIQSQSFELIAQGQLISPASSTPFSIEKYIEDDEAHFDLYVVNIDAYFDRPGVYADERGHFYADEAERYIAFQHAVLQWIKMLPVRPDILHCHDHHTGLIPFLTTYSIAYGSLAMIPTVFTIHNGQYQGMFSEKKMAYLPDIYENEKWRILLNGHVNPLAAGIRCSWKVTTVSPNYLKELTQNASPLGELIRQESNKCLGILNGINTHEWDPKTDQKLTARLGINLRIFKERNKQIICSQFDLHPDWPLMVFIGRFAKEKGAYILPDTIHTFFQHHYRADFLILGSGDPKLARSFNELKDQYPHRYNCYIGYQEELAHLLYAGADFLIMPSLVEPCGLNQMYAMRYGTIPVVCHTGGLSDTVTDIDQADGYGILFDHDRSDDLMTALHRAVFLYKDTERFDTIRNKIIHFDFSWEKSNQQYLNIYQSLIPKLRSYDY